VSDINIAAVDSLKVLDPNRPIREAINIINIKVLYCIGLVALGGIKCA